jgi:hypothetical protein
LSDGLIRRSSGIEVFIPDESMATLRPHLLLGTGGVRVQVHASEADRARELLAQIEKNPET